MADDPKPATPPAGNPGTPPAGDPTTPPNDPGPEPKVFDLAYVEKLRQESADYRTKLRAAEADLEKRRASELSETDRAKKEAADATAKLTEAETRIKAAQTRAEIATLGAALKLVDADDAYRLLDQAAIQYDDDGRPKNLKPLLEALIKAKPYLVQGATTTTSANNPGREGGLTYTKEQLAKMTPQQVAKLDQKLVDQALAAG